MPNDFWRRIELVSRAGAAWGRVTDNVHDFEVMLQHNGEVVTDVTSISHRFPWVTCPAAGLNLRALVGARLGTSHGLSVDQSQQCTHMLDVAKLALRHAARSGERRYEVVATQHRPGAKAIASLSRDGESLIRWDILGDKVTGPSPFAGHYLQGRSKWSEAVLADPDTLEAALILRRAVFVFQRRPLSQTVRRAEELPDLEGACFSFQSSRVKQAVRPPGFVELP
jgi:hypothetical protein